MKIILAPDKFKGALSGFEFCRAVESGLKSVIPDLEVIPFPLADGGDGTMEVVSHYLQAEQIAVSVSDPLFRPITASYAFALETKTAYIEMAEASGLWLLQGEGVSCMDTSSRGTGELIADALRRGATEIILGIGGSATTDGGMGMAAGLGYTFHDEKGAVLAPIGRNMRKVAHINSEQVLPEIEEANFRIACDVQNPFYGLSGAAHIYGPQKGASPEEVLLLDKGLENLSRQYLKHFSIDVQRISGSGAAGGMGGGSLVFLGGQLESGIKMIMEMSGIAEGLDGASWIITGEGKLDSQTSSGKTLAGVLEVARNHGIPVAAFCGQLDISKESASELGYTYIKAVSEHCASLEEALAKSYENVVQAATAFAAELKA